MAAGKRAKTPKSLPRQDASTHVGSCRGESLGKALESERANVPESECANVLRSERAAIIAVAQWSIVGLRSLLTGRWSSGLCSSKSVSYYSAVFAEAHGRSLGSIISRAEKNGW